MMSFDEKSLKTNLQAALYDLGEASKWLNHSYEICNAFKQPISGTQAIDAFEAFTSRYSRAVDILIHQVLRNLALYERIDPGTLIDISNRAEKEYLVENADVLKQLKDFRNTLIHEYAAERLNFLYVRVHELAPILLTVITNTFAHCANKYAISA